MNRSLKQEFLDVYLTTFSEFVTSEIEKLWGSSLFYKRWKFKLTFKNAAINLEKCSCFWENCIWIGIIKLSLLRTGYLSSAGNVLTTSPRFYMSMRGTFSNSVFFPVTNEFEKGAVMEISTVLWQVYDIAFPGVLWNWTI